MQAVVSGHVKLSSTAYYESVTVLSLSKTGMHSQLFAIVYVYDPLSD